jgi:hypothetical protein
MLVAISMGEQTVQLTAQTIKACLDFHGEVIIHD